jgi:SAM-dependent methyltransferase
MCWACGATADAVPDDSGYTRCSACDLRFYARGEAPRDRYGREYFEHYRGGDYAVTEPVRRHEARVRVGLLSEVVETPGELLELGSATGLFLDEARARGWRVRGIEPSAHASTIARERRGLDVREAFAEDVELGEAVVDAICAWHTLEHLVDPLPLMGRLHRALRPDGRLLLEVPNGASRMARRQGSRWFPLEPDVHMAQWTPTALTAVLARAGFRAVKVETVPFLTYVPTARRRLPRRLWLAMRQRAWVRDPHASAHELLRAVATR